MNERIKKYTYLIMFALLCYMVLKVKSQIQGEIARSIALNEVINNQRNTISLLTAELAYLKSPERIKKLASKHLKLSKIQNNQIVSDPLDILDKNDEYPQGIEYTIDSITHALQKPSLHPDLQKNDLTSSYQDNIYFINIREKNVKHALSTKTFPKWRYKINKYNNSNNDLNHNNQYNAKKINLACESKINVKDVFAIKLEYAGHK